MHAKHSKAMTEESHKDIARQLHPSRIILPVIIGLIVVLWLIVRDVNVNVLKEIKFTWNSVFWLLVAFLLVAMRTFFYMVRIRGLTNNDLSWVQSFRVIMLWEFSSAITPSTVGGTALAVIFLHKEGINTGRSTAVVLATSFLDEVYFVIMLPLLLLFIGGKSIFITSLHGMGIGLMNNLVIVAVTGYIIILAWVLFAGYGLFINPAVIKKLIVAIFRLPFLKRWKSSAEKAGNDLIESSEELRKESFSFWGKSIISTFLTWTARYLVVNAILLAFFRIGDHILIFARQLVLWIMMIVSPTPGGSGFAEVILGKYLSDLIPADPVHVGGVALAMALLWRFISYYPFLILGALIVPGWIQRKFIRPIIKKK
jgi:glycosyltransferase 2 family protein